MAKVTKYQEFLQALRASGFTMAGDNPEGIFSLCDQFTEAIRWHTEESDTDPWEWRIRVLKEEKDIAYGKFFFKKGSFLTKEWFPYFYAVRRGNTTLHREYEKGMISFPAKRIYELLQEEHELAVHEIKQGLGFGKGKEERPQFDAALTELQMKFYLMPVGEARKVTKKGEPYGWPATVFGLADEFFEKDVLEKAKNITKQEAYEKIEEQVLRLNPDADSKRINKFILGE